MHACGGGDRWWRHGKALDEGGGEDEAPWWRGQKPEGEAHLELQSEPAAEPAGEASTAQQHEWRGHYDKGRHDAEVVHGIRGAVPYKQWKAERPETMEEQFYRHGWDAGMTELDTPPEVVQELPPEPPYIRQRRR
jgi:hypothetical protein